MNDIEKIGNELFKHIEKIFLNSTNPEPKIINGDFKIIINFGSNKHKIFITITQEAIDDYFACSKKNKINAIGRLSKIAKDLFSECLNKNQQAEIIIKSTDLNG